VKVLSWHRGQFEVVGMLVVGVSGRLALRFHCCTDVETELLRKSPTTLAAATSKARLSGFEGD